MPTISSTVLTYFTYKLGIMLAKPFKEWQALKFGLIDEKGNIVKKPKTPEEKDALNPFYNLIRKLKYIIVKFGGDTPAINFLIAYLLIKKESCSEEEKQIQIEIHKIINENNIISWDEFIQIIKKLSKDKRYAK